MHAQRKMGAAPEQLGSKTQRPVLVLDREQGAAGSDAPQNGNASCQGQDMVEHDDGTPPPLGPAHVAFAGELRQEIFDGLHRADTQCRRQFAQRGGIPATGQGTVNYLQ